jgi:four helix bundle protein
VSQHNQRYQIMDKSNKQKVRNSCAILAAMIYDVTDLDVYNRALKALKLVYQLEKQIPTSHYKLRVQFTSAAEGIPAHIAEGFGKRKSVKEWKRYLEIGIGSSDETITQARIVEVLAEYGSNIDKELCQKVIAEYKIISKQLNNLRNKWVDFNTK